MKSEVYRQILEIIIKYQISWKFVQWEPSCSMRTDGQTWRNLKAAFRNFSNAFTVANIKFTPASNKAYTRLTLTVHSFNEPQ